MANNQQQMPRGAPFARSIMAHNPHWDETINEDITITDLPPWSPQEEWADVGGGGEFSGSRREEVLPSVNMPGSWRGGPEGYENYPADEFTGIQSNVPSSGTLKKIFENIYPRIENYIQKQRQLMEDYYNQYKPGPWNEFNPSSPEYPLLEPGQNRRLGEDGGEDLLAKIYTSDMPGMINEGSWESFMPGGDPLWDEVSPGGEAINQILQDSLLQKTIQGLIQAGETDPNVFRQYIRPDILEQLPPGAFTTINDFINQQPITVT